MNECDCESRSQDKITVSMKFARDIAKCRQQLLNKKDYQEARGDVRYNYTYSRQGQAQF